MALRRHVKELLLLAAIVALSVASAGTLVAVDPLTFTEVMSFQALLFVIVGYLLHLNTKFDGIDARLDRIEMRMDQHIKKIDG